MKICQTRERERISFPLSSLPLSNWDNRVGSKLRWLPLNSRQMEHQRVLVDGIVGPQEEREGGGWRRHNPRLIWFRSRDKREEASASRRETAAAGWTRKESGADAKDNAANRSIRGAFCSSTLRPAIRFNYDWPDRHRKNRLCLPPSLSKGMMLRKYCSIAPLANPPLLFDEDIVHREILEKE